MKTSTDTVSIASCAIVFLATALALFATVVEAAEPTLAEAQAHLSSKDWAAAAAAFEAIRQAEPENGQAWQGLGQAWHGMGKHAKALTAYAKAIELGFQPAVGMLLSARSEAARGGADEAMAWLHKMAGAGLKPYQSIIAMPELQSLAERKDYQAFLAGIRPCTAAEFRQFDFWVGEWDVASSSGSKAVNSIRLDHGGCTVREDYVAGAYTGSSLSFYDSGKGRWHQTWIDNQGNPLYLEGGLEEGKMVLYSAKGSTPRSRVTWSPLSTGQVRQLWESSADSGETWSVVFDGTYSRRSAAAE